eukprot:5505635-Pyramimonas_sp.AAC.1
MKGTERTELLGQPQAEAADIARLMCLPLTQDQTASQWIADLSSMWNRHHCPRIPRDVRLPVGSA